MTGKLILVAMATTMMTPALARAEPAAGEVTSGARAALPAQLGANARAAYRGVFDAIASARWDEALAGLNAIPSGPLHAYARAQIFLAKGSPRIDGATLAALAAEMPDLPQAPTLTALAQARGVEALPILPSAHELRWLGAAPRRVRVTGDSDTIGLAASLVALVKDDKPSQAEAALTAAEPTLAPSMLSEWQQRIAWSYFLTGDDRAARTLAAKARGERSDWGAQANWVFALAAWRQKDWSAAADAFAQTTQVSSDPEMVAAGHYWAARAEMAGGHPERVQPHLRSAARLEETFYGLLAQAAMGVTLTKRDSSAAIRTVEARPNVRIALALAEIGLAQRADELLRWQARIGPPVEHAGLTLLAGKLNLPATQLYLAHNGPSGATTSAEGRYPAPEGWLPEGGWRVDRALMFAHTLEESRFRADAVSKAGARGLMQVRPGTAAELARRKGLAFVGSLDAPATNMEFGQSYIEQLRDMPATGGLLPKVIAAYNAGTTPLDRWNARGDALNRDPLLYIESISYWETRGYVTTVLRNYWMYQQQAGTKTASRDSLVQGLWPRFPGASTGVSWRAAVAR